MKPEQLADRLDAAWGNPDDWVANGLQWGHLDEIKEMINRRVSGDPAVSPMQWFANYLASLGKLPARRALVLGCGSGRTERELASMGWASEIVAFDLSPKVLAVAQAAAADIPSITYVTASMDSLPVGTEPFMPASFDVVYGMSSVHHCSDLPSLYTAVEQLLVPDGCFFLDEYVGPDQFQFSATHIAQVTDLANLLPDRLMTTLGGKVRRGFRAPTVDEVVAEDPSEAVASSRILALLQEHFDVIAQRPYGGTLMHLLLATVAQNFKPAQAKPWLQALIDAEDDLDRLGQLEQHFSCAIARPRRAASASPNAHR